MVATSGLVSIIYFVGMLFVYVGERLIGGDSGARTVCTAMGVLCVVGALGARIVRRGKASADHKPVETAAVALYALGLVALLLYFATSDLFGMTLDKSSPRLAVSLSALWPALLTFSLFPLLCGEISYASMAQAPKIESGRVRDALLSGVGLAGVLVFAFSINYVATQRDKRVDLSYFRTAKAGESTKKIVAGLDQPLSISIFFPPASEVRGEVMSYLDDLKKESKLLEINSLDKDVDPAKAQSLGVSGNGMLVVHRGPRKEVLALGVELEAARGQLRNLDREVQKRILLVGRAARVVYLTTGHGERTAYALGETDKRAGNKELRDLLSAQGYTVKDLGAAEGLAAEVPADAAAVLAIGPQRAFATEEAQALSRYVDRGGRLLYAFDPENGVDFANLLAPLGVTFSTTTLANDQAFGRINQQISDHANIVTGSYSSHPAVTVLGRYGMRAPSIFPGAGALEAAKDKPAGVTVEFPIRSLPSTFADKNGNFTFDTGVEQRKQYELEAAVQKKRGGKPEEDARALVLGDSDALADLVFQPHSPNQQIALDGMKWLLGDEATAGEVSSEVDTPITHTRKQDVVWFYSTIFLMPALAVLAGWLVNRRRKKEAA